MSNLMDVGGKTLREDGAEELPGPYLGGESIAILKNSQRRAALREFMEKAASDLRRRLRLSAMNDWKRPVVL